jgi:hypothetical protein
MRRKFIRHLIEISLSLREQAEEARDYATSREDIEGWEPHAKYWEGVRWGTKVLADSMARLENEDGLFDKVVEKALSRLERENKDLRKKLDRATCSPLATTIDNRVNQKQYALEF